jgi:hypothetical protein
MGLNGRMGFGGLAGISLTFALIYLLKKSSFPSNCRSQRLSAHHMAALQNRFSGDNPAVARFHRAGIRRRM